MKHENELRALLEQLGIIDRLALAWLGLTTKRGRR